MSVPVPVRLDPELSLPAALLSSPRIEAWEFGNLFGAYLVDAQGRLWEGVRDLGEDGGIDSGENFDVASDPHLRRIPLHGFLEVEIADGTRWSLRFTYGLLDGAREGGDQAWSPEHEAT